MNADTTAPITLTAHESEAFMWSLAEISDRPRRSADDPSDPLAVLLKAGWKRAAIMKACKTMEERGVIIGALVPPFEPIVRDILRVSVENSSWIVPYQKHGPSSLLDEHGARRVLRELAQKLEQLGIEVNFLPDG